jgi:putative ABC transport system substrate-binding protein
MIDRRTLLAGAGAMLLAAPRAAQGQQAGRVWKVGYLTINSPDAVRQFLGWLEAGLRDLGYVQGKDYVVESRVATARADRLPGLARELVDARVDVIIAGSNQEIAALKAATTVIPIVMVVGVNPVGSGFVASLAKPGGNITGTTYDATPEGTAKNLEFLVALVPRAKHVAVLWDPSFPGIEAYMESVNTAAGRLGVQIRAVAARSPEELPPALVSLARARDDAVLVMGSSLFFARRADIIAGLNGKRLPAIYWTRQLVDIGGLMSYGVNLRALWARTAIFLDKIFRGARPADLPVEQPTQFELVINMKTAKTLGLTIPPSLLGRADEVIR